MGSENIALEEYLGTHAAERIAIDLEIKGWSVTDDFLSPQRVTLLAEEIEELWRGGSLRQAGIGRDDTFQVNPKLRTDQVQWLDSSHCTYSQQHYLNTLEGLRLILNRALFLGLFEFEGHLALYPPGSYYRKHLDQFIGNQQRMVTCILYLNSNWEAGNGGQLRIYTDPEKEYDYEEILPIGGRLVVFLSARFQHEVMPAQRNRLSISGWFRTRDELFS